jgi:hypothetical protein
MTLHLQFEKEAEAAKGLPPNVHSYALLPIGYPMGQFGPVRRVPLADVVYEDRWGPPYRDRSVSLPEHRLIWGSARFATAPVSASVIHGHSSALRARRKGLSNLGFVFPSSARRTAR